ncbi:F-box domain-containing protein [Podospora aff. communis PSN243]|uniref:F-box domain-containing protein n=1 Tax=Podospora aff. communis PSN243 TaxID=3040156 RepID=A0AAV9G2C5_9PEZI|nr:F-box domain-containing protein [Podospora aff. communis PSN243]
MASPASINSVPNEILISILVFLPSSALLPLTAVNRRFSSVILRILRQRLVEASSLPDHRLILECYHPADKLSTPYLYGDYLWTDSIDDANTRAIVAKGQDPPDLTVSALGRMYSHFRPVKQDENRRGRRRYPRQSEAQAAAQDSLPDRPYEDVFLDGGELFSQLCTVTNLVKVGPKQGLFLSHVNLNDGLIRVFRDWLAAQATDSSPGAQAPILWTDTSQAVGVRFRVSKRDPGWERMPLLVEADEDEASVSYRLEFEELLVRSGHLLLMMEESEKQQVTTQSGKAIVVIASF